MPIIRGEKEIMNGENIINEVAERRM